MRIQELSAALNAIAQAAPSGRGSIKPSVEKVIAFLEAKNALTVDDLVAEFGRSVAARSSNVAPIVLRDHLVARHVKALRDAGSDYAVFQDAISALKSDRQVRVKPELRAIVNQYEGSDRAYSSKIAALAVIEEQFRRRALSAHHARGPKTSAAG